MLRDLGSRDSEFIAVVRSIRERLLVLAGVKKGEYEAVLIQGSGTFSVEAFFSSCIPPNGKVLILDNGAYGARMIKICGILKIPTQVLCCPENEVHPLNELEEALESDPTISHVAVVHCETTTGIINPIHAIGEIVKSHGRLYFVDAMSSFGAIPIDLKSSGIDFLVSSANKCIEGVPGFGFVLARTEDLVKTEGYARSLSLDLYSQWKGLEANGQFRFTPPTHALLAFHQALLEIDQEGGVEARADRYRTNHQVLVTGMRRLGFSEFVDPNLQGYIITSFLYPDDSNFDFEVFYHKLNDLGFVIYPGKLSQADCFRIGSIGRLSPFDMSALLLAIERTLMEMDVRMGGPRIAAS
jgi:2-aminoethylphosphonate-pyruvate transaminase